jgi:hypothetical protein
MEDLMKDPTAHFNALQTLALLTALAAVLRQIPGGIAGFELDMRERVDAWDAAARDPDPQRALDAATMSGMLTRAIDAIMASHLEMKKPPARRR